MLRLLVFLATVVIAAAAVASSECEVATKRIKCDNTNKDETTHLQAALNACHDLILPVNKICVTYPLTLSSNFILTIPANTTLKAGNSIHWPNASETHALPLLTAPMGTTNLTIRGYGTIDGSGDQWWGGCCRPHMLTLPGATNVLLENFLMLNSADFHAELHGSNYQIFGIRFKRVKEQDKVSV